MSSYKADHIPEVNINNIGRDYNDHRQINHFRFDAERDAGLLRLESRQFLDELGRKSALGALSYAEARRYAPRCHSKTRSKILDDLGEWSAGEGPWKDVKLLVLTAPAGHGKSAIMQTFSERLAKKSEESDTHLVVATFFFKASIPEQNDSKALVTTLAHQIAEHCPSIRPKIVAAIRDKVGIFSASLHHEICWVQIRPDN